MTIALDIIGSVILVAMLSMLIFQMHFYMYETSFETNETYRLQSTSEIIRQILRNDLKEIGSNLSEKKNLILSAERNRVKFILDPSNNNDKNIHYFELICRDYPALRDPTPNPFDKDLVKIENNGITQNYGFLGLCDFTLTYYDKNLNKISYTDLQNQNKRDEIRFVEFSYKLLSKEPLSYKNGVNDRYSYPMAIAQERFYLKTFYE